MADNARPAWLNATSLGIHATVDGASPDVALTTSARDGDEEFVRPSSFPGPAARFYRPGSLPGRLTGNQPANVVGNGAALLAETKLGPGSPNYYDNELPTGQPFGPDDVRLNPIPETAHNERDDATPVFNPGLTQARAGSTSADNTRASKHQRTFLMRPFDKLISEHPDALGRIIAPAPFAARPRQLAANLEGAFPSPGGSMKTNGAGGGVGVMSQPNTQRLLPNDWDEQLINTGGTDQGQAAEDNRRAVGWRGR